jgi:hypothetical protein
LERRNDLLVLKLADGADFGVDIWAPSPSIEKFSTRNLALTLR